MNRLVVAALCAGLLAQPALAREPTNIPVEAAPSATPVPLPPIPLLHPSPPPPPPLAHPAIPPSVAEPGPREDSFPGFVNGKSTVKDVTAKFGRPSKEDQLSGPNASYSYTYFFDRGKTIAVFQFSKNGVLLRVRIHKKNA